MSIIFYNADATVRKAEVTAAISTRLHQSLNGECTLDVTMPGKMLPGIVPGDYVRMETLYFTVNRVQRSSHTAGALFSVTCEHISYLLNDLTMPEGTYSGSVSSVLGTILAGTPLSVGSVDVSGSFEIVVGANTNRRQVLQQWASITGAEISYAYTQVNFRRHVGSSTAVELSETENVKSLSIQMDGNNNSISYEIELSRLQTLKMGDAVHIQYASLEVDTTTRVISLDYDVFHPWNISMQCGDYVPTYYEQVNDDFDDYEDALEETKGEIVEEIENTLSGANEILIDQLSTSRRIKKYILSDTSDDNYLLLQNNYLRLMSGVATGSTEQATDLNGNPLYWQKQPVGHTAAGLPTDSDGNIIYPTLKSNSWPIMVYTYTETVKGSLSLQNDSGNYLPQMVFGAGDNLGRTKGTIAKNADGFDISFEDTAGEALGLKMNSAGYMDLYGLRKPTELDFSGWDYGYFSEELDGGITGSFIVDFDADGKPIKITDGDGHQTVVVW